METGAKRNFAKRLSAKFIQTTKCKFVFSNLLNVKLFLASRLNVNLFFSKTLNCFSQTEKRRCAKPELCLRRSVSVSVSSSLSAVR